MIIKIDNKNINREEDPGYWYVWALSFDMDFRFLFSQQEKMFQKKTYNFYDIENTIPSSIVMWTIYAHTLELYMKAYLLAKHEANLTELRSKNYSHNLESLRLKCAGLDKAFDNDSLKFITQKVRKFTNLGWEFIKYPPIRPALKTKPKLLEGQFLPGMFGKKTMIPPLDILENIVRPLVYIEA